MPDQAKHAFQALHNEQLLSEPVFELSKTEYADWVITICFYCAVHLIDAKLAQQHRIIDIPNHDERRAHVHEYFSTKNDIVKLYETLDSESRRARYHCKGIDLKRARDAVDLLNKLKKELSA